MNTFLHVQYTNDIVLFRDKKIEIKWLPMSKKTGIR